MPEHNTDRGAERCSDGYKPDNAADEQRLIAFWDGCYADQDGEKTVGAAIEDPVFRDVIERWMPENGEVLDYGCGTGWMLLELAFSKPIRAGVGIDTSANGIRCAGASAALSGMEQLTFRCGDERLLAGEPGRFDFAVSVNTLDVVPDETAHRILTALQAALKPGAVLMLCLNPYFTEREMTQLLGMEQRGRLYYRDGILRCCRRDRAEWEALLSAYFAVEEYHTFVIAEREVQHPRQMFLLRRRTE